MIDIYALENAKDFNSDDFWIGANVYTKLPSKPWVWTDRQQLVVYSVWATEEPSGEETRGDQCAAVSILDGTWRAVDCNLAKPYVCSVLVS